MNQPIIAGMPEVLRLTRAGRLHEATSAIQRMLGGQPFTPSETELAAQAREAPIEGVFRVMKEQPARADAMHENRTTRPQPVPSRAPEGIPRGQFISGSYSNHAGTRSYRLYIPGCYHGQSLPLLVMLHGCSQSPEDFAAGTRMNQLAEEHRCLVLYPAQAKGANSSKCWNWFKPGDQRRDLGEPSIIAGMTRQIAGFYHADPQRIYVAGLSAGGAMAVTMAMTYPEIFAAIGVHSGLAFAVAHDLPSAFAAMRQGKVADGHAQIGIGGTGDRLVPAIVFHGDRDTTVHPRNGDQVIAQSRATPLRDNAGADASAKSRVRVQRGQIAKGHAYTRTVYHDNNGQSNVEHWLVHGGGHAWSGGCSSGSFTDPKGPDATQEMMRFFLEHPQHTRH